MQAKATAFKYHINSKDLPATQGMLHLVRTELKAEMRAGFSRMNSRFEQMDSKFSEFDARFEEGRSEMARMAVLIEEQNSRNTVVLEGLTGLYERQERLEKRFDGFEELLRSIARGRT